MRVPWFHRESSSAGAKDPWALSTPLLRWSRDDVWTIGDAVCGTLVTGATGSGKSSGSGAAIARSLLASGFGGIVCVAKPNELAEWGALSRATGREADLRVFGAGSDLRFNFLDYAAQQQGLDAGLTENLVCQFSTVLDVAGRGSGGGSEGDGGRYWVLASRQLIRNAIDLLLLSGAGVSVPELYRVVISAPTSASQKRSPEWQSQSLCFRRLAQADARELSAREQKDLEVVADYFLVEFPELSEKTRSVIVSTFTSMADVLMRGQAREWLCTSTSITPDAVVDGAIIVLNVPVKTFGEIGIFTQVLWKDAFQRSIERRDLSKNARPVFLWADEAQYFVTSNDMQFQTTCRSSRVATVYLTQNLSNLHAALGGSEKGRSEASSLLANLNNKLVHANGDTLTNDWAASLIGRSRQFMANGSGSRSMDSGWPFGLGEESLTQPGSTSAGFSEAFEYEVQPSAFTRLRTGGPSNNWTVDAILFQNGRLFRATGKTWMPVKFQQAH